MKGNTFKVIKDFVFFGIVFRSGEILYVTRYFKSIKTGFIDVINMSSNRIIYALPVDDYFDEYLKIEQESSTDENIKICVNNGICIICGEKTNAYPFKMTHCRACANKDMDKKAEKSYIKEKMNIKDAITALYEGKKVRSLPSHHEYVLRDGMIDFVDEGLKEKWEPNISSDELDCKWEIIEDE